MTETTSTTLRQLFLERYDHLRTWLTWRLGSADLANETLQDTWLRLARINVTGTVHSPGNYLLRMLFNVAQDRRRSEKRHLNVVEVETLLHLADEAPNPAEVTEAKSEFAALIAILAELPPRRRAILLAARVDGMPRQEIARRLGVSLRLVSKELHLAHEYCMAHRQKN